MKRILSFGEILLRFTPPDGGGWIATRQMPVFIGGAEASVARTLARWGMPSGYITAVPPHYLAKDVIGQLEREGVAVNNVIYRPGRLGIFYMPASTDMKHGAVIYDREGSSFAGLKTGTLNWDTLLDGIDWLHISAISPALNREVAAVCEEGLQAAAIKGITTSIDLNYRPALWQYGALPNTIMPRLVQYCDIVMGNIWAAEKMLGIVVDLPADKVLTQADYLKQATQTSIAIQAQFPKCKAVANTFRFTGNEQRVTYYGSLYSSNELFCSAAYNTGAIVDKVGSGDCFMAGLIYSYSNNYSPQDTIDFATAAGYSKLFIKGDTTSLQPITIKNHITHG